jgi:flagellar assembly protein FliH
VTKLLSSLLKSSFWIPQDTKKLETRVIDTNELVATKIEAILAAEKEINREEDGDGFVSGLEAQTVEELLEVEKTPEALKEEAEALVESARQEADEILAAAEKNAQALKNAAYEQGEKTGYEDGYHKAMAEGEEIKDHLREQMQNLETDYHQRLEEMEPLLLNKILEVLDGALAIKLSQDREILLHLLKKNMGQVGNSENFFVRASTEDIEVLREHRDFFMQALTPGTRLEFIEDATLTPGMCQLETDGGVFDCSLDTQFGELKKNLCLLANS